jgi:DNA-binding MarR family transcriptional regulator
VVDNGNWLPLWIVITDMGIPSANAEALTQVILAIFRANGRLLEWGDRFVAPLGITSARWQMIGALGISEKAISAPQVASTMGVTRQGAQKQLNLLLVDGLIEQLANPKHQRSPLYQLSNQGKKLYRLIDHDWLKAAERLSIRLPANKLLEVMLILNQLCEHLDSDNVNGKERR